MKQYAITALGEILIDCIPDGTDEAGDARFIRKAGGAPLNVLATAQKYGLQTAFIGKLGADVLGDYLETVIRRCGIAYAVPRDTVHNTTLAFVTLDADGDRQFSFYRRFGADTFLSREDVDAECIRDSAVFHFGSLSFTAPSSAAATAYALQIARQAGCTISFDPNYREKLWESAEDALTAMRDGICQADIVKLSLEEAEMICGSSAAEDVFRYCDARGVRMVVITDGANGVRYFANGESGFLPSLPVKAVDTTGAGDIFFGTFLSGFVKSGLAVNAVTEKDCARFVQAAIKAAGRSTERHGAIASIPDAAEIGW